MKIRLCVIIAMLGMLGSQASAQSERHAKGYKDPKTAVAWGYLLPGAGHIYAGEAGKGWLLMLGSVGALAGGVAMTLASGDDSALSRAERSFLDEDFGAGGTRSSTVKAEETDMVPAYVGIGVFAVGWIYSIADAAKAAERTNRKHGLGWLKPVRVAPYVAGKAESREYGVRLAFDL